MGGSGGGGGGYLPRNLAQAEREKMQREAVEQAGRDRDEAETNQALLSLLSRFNDRDVEQVKDQLDDVRKCLGSEIEVEAILNGGSVAKHTYVNGLSDVDALVVVDGTVEETPAELKRRFAELLSARLPMGGVEAIREGHLAVTVKYSDGTELQLLPAKRTANGVAISSRTGEHWSSIRPQAFAKALSEVNKLQGGAVIPAIKLAKSLIAGLPDNSRLSGYHVEALAVEAFQSYNGRRTPVTMLRTFFDFAAERVRRPVSDVTGQSNHVDAYLGPVGSTERKIVADRLATVSRQLHAAADPARWKELVDSGE